MPPRSSAGVPHNSFIGILGTVRFFIALEVKVCEVTVDADAVFVGLCLPRLHKLKIVVKVY